MNREKRFAACLDQNETADELRADAEAAARAGAAGPPTFYVNGRRVAGAATVDELSALVDDELARAKQPDLILLDIGLPAMDGKTLCRIIKTHPETAAIKVIMLTGDRLMGDMEDSFSAGADFYLNKPCDLALLLSHMEKLLRQTPAK